jgi:hypothetical protein
MIEYFYTGDYSGDTGVENEVEPLSTLDLHAKVFALADKYDAQSLCKRAADQYRSRLKNCGGDEFLASISSVYEATPPAIRSLRNVAMQYAQTQLQRMARGQESLRETFLEVVEAVPEFAKDICESWIGSPTRGHCHDCGPGQPLEILQARCLSCGRGGASAYK